MHVCEVRGFDRARLKASFAQKDASVGTKISYDLAKSENM